MYPNLKAEMAKNNISMEKIANLLGLHRNTVKNKIDKPEGSFSIEEVFAIKAYLFPHLDISYLFFKQKISKKGA